MNYKKFLDKKIIKIDNSGFDIEINKLNKNLFDFQKAIVKWSLKKGRSAIFADCGTGKTIMQLEWANQINKKYKKPILILAPLAVSQQTKEEGDRFGIKVKIVEDQSDIINGINITNYEKLHKFNAKYFIGIVLDESSILKSYTGKFRNKLIDDFQFTKYKLACTATPSPNDFMELGNHCEFLNVMSRVEMLAMYFINDVSHSKTWRLKGHAESEFWKFIGTWAVMLKDPSDIGFNNKGYILPELIENEIILKSERTDGQLFTMPVMGFNEIRGARKESLINRIDEVEKILNKNPNKQFIIWCDYNIEGDMLEKKINGSIQLSGKNTNEFKAKTMLDFAKGKVNILITKPKIAGFGMNWQNCSNVIFCGLSYSYESYYQAIRRCWRFGQKNNVNVYIVLSEKEIKVLNSIKQKRKNHIKMNDNIINNVKTYFTFMKKEKKYNENIIEEKNYKIMLGDCVEQSKKIEDESIHYSIFSPPFASLYTYSDSERDMGNCKGDDEFYEHYKFLIKEQFRITKPGRLLSFHCMLLPTRKSVEGYIGIKDFRGDLIRMYQEEGWIFQSEVVIWKDPVVAMQRTKALGLLHRQIKKDSAMSRQGIADYVITMRKPGENIEPITHTPESYPVNYWQKIASPIWTDIKQGNTLQKTSAREEKDEKHICPLQLEVIRRCLYLWTNPGDLVCSPFMGIGSEGYESLKADRKFVGIELKESYFNQADKNLQVANNLKKQQTLF